MTAINGATNQVINAELGTNCIQFNDYHISNSFEASVIFAVIFTAARAQIASELNAGLLVPNTVSIRARLTQIIRGTMSLEYPGSTFGSSGCSGDIPSSVADYGC